MDKKTIATILLSLTAISGGYLITDQQKKELEQKIDEVQYIHAKTVIDQRGDTIDLSEILGDKKVTRVIINGEVLETKQR